MYVGESQNNVEGRIGGDASLTERGKAYSVALAKKINDMEMDGLLIWTSCMKRTLQVIVRKIRYFPRSILCELLCF